jgi:putative phage-type endonuclease
MTETSYDRRAYIGGSDIASIFGVSPWKTALDLYEEKTAETFVQPEIEPKREKLFRRGKKLEPWIMELLEEEHGINIFQRNQRYVDDEYSWMRCEIDFEFMHDLGHCNGEAKTVSPFAAKDWGEEGADEIPLYYCLQAMWGLMITMARPATLVAPLIGADDLRVYWVKRDEELIAEMRRRAVQFWTENVQKRIPPAPQNIADCNKLLFRFGGFACLADEQVTNDIRALKEVRKREREVQTEKGDLEMKIKRFLTVQAEVAGAKEDTKKFQIVGADNKPMATLSLQHRAAYEVKESDFFVLRCGKE